MKNQYKNKNKKTKTNKGPKHINTITKYTQEHTLKKKKRNR